MSPASRTVSWCRDSIVTIVALERAIPKMVGQGDTAVGTFEGKAAIRTENKIGKPSSIEEEEALLPLSEILLKCCP
jgi:hypothetical protein